VVCDFPFKAPVHQATWLAFLLTLVSRHAFSGSAPLFLIEANTPGSGKGLLVDVAARIATGRDKSVMTAPRDDDEVRKRITAIALAGDQLVLIDNVAGYLGGAALNAALTATIWQERILGKTEMTPRLPMRVTWAATGNNIVLGPDTPRRVAHIRLDSPEENPEDRQGFRHHRLLDWVSQERPRLLAAALTLLRGYCLVGRPDMELKPWGSFEAWSDLVRNTVVWSFLPDPGETRNEIRERHDQEVSTLRAIIAGVEDLDPNRQGITTAEIVAKLSLLQLSDAAAGLKEALIASCKAGKPNELPSTKSIGSLFRRMENRIAGGKCIAGSPKRNLTYWRVQDLDRVG
jgi:hypothetical protein